MKENSIEAFQLRNGSRSVVDTELGMREPRQAHPARARKLKANKGYLPEKLL